MHILLVFAYKSSHVPASVHLYLCEMCVCACVCGESTAMWYVYTYVSVPLCDVHTCLVFVVRTQLCGMCTHVCLSV